MTCMTRSFPFELCEGTRYQRRGPRRLEAGSILVARFSSKGALPVDEANTLLDPRLRRVPAPTLAAAA